MVKIFTQHILTFCIFNSSYECLIFMLVPIIFSFTRFRVQLRTWKQSRLYFSLSLSIFSFNSLQSLICSEYLSGMSIAFRLFCGHCTLCDCGCGCWSFCRLCRFWGWRAAVFVVHFECTGYSVDFYCHSSPLLHFLNFCKWCSWSPSTFSTFGIMMAWGVAASWVCGSTFIDELEVDVGGIGQSFLNSNRFPDIDPALGHGVPAWVRIFSSGEDCC